MLAAALNDRIEKHMQLGATPGERLDADEGLLGCRELVHKLAALRTSIGADIDSGCWQDEVEKATDYLKELSDYLIPAKVENLQGRAAEVSEWAAGGPQGAAWHAAVDRDAGFEAFLAAGKDTVLAKNIDEYKNTRDELTRHAAGIKDACELFAVAVPDIVETAQQVCHKLAVSQVEGMLVSLYAAKHTKEKYKEKTHAVKRLAKNLGLKWDRDVCARLQDRAVSALSLRLTGAA